MHVGVLEADFLFLPRAPEQADATPAEPQPQPKPSQPAYAQHIQALNAHFRSRHELQIPARIAPRPSTGAGLASAFHLPPNAAEKDGNNDDEQEASLRTPATKGPARKEKMPRIKRPRNSWIIYRSEKSKLLHRNNPTMSAGTICEFLCGILLIRISPSSCVCVRVCVKQGWLLSVVFADSHFPACFSYSGFEHVGERNVGCCESKKRP